MRQAPQALHEGSIAFIQTWDAGKLDVGVQCTSPNNANGKEIHHFQLPGFRFFGAVLSCTAVSHLAFMCCAAKAPFSFVALLEVILGLTASVLAEARASLIEWKRSFNIIDQTGLLRLENWSCRDYTAPMLHTLQARI